MSALQAGFYALSDVPDLDNFADPDNEPKMLMADQNSQLAAAVHHFIIKEAGVLDSNSIPFLWLIAVTVLQDRSRNTHYEPGTRIDTKDDLRMI